MSDYAWSKFSKHAATLFKTRNRQQLSSCTIKNNRTSSPRPSSTDRHFKTRNRQQLQSHAIESSRRSPFSWPSSPERVNVVQSMRIQTQIPHGTHNAKPDLQSEDTLISFWISLFEYSQRTTTSHEISNTRSQISASPTESKWATSRVYK